jgi:Rrf2 family protein
MDRGKSAVEKIPCSRQPWGAKSDLLLPQLCGVTALTADSLCPAFLKIGLDEEDIATILVTYAEVSIMNTSSRFVVALHVLAALAITRLIERLQCMNSEMLAKSVNTNPVVVRRLLGRLRQAGLVESLAGACGGSRLARDPEQITLLEVYEAVEEGDLFHMHYSDPNKNCPIGCNIQQVLQAPLGWAEAAMKQSLAQTTLAAIAEQVSASSRPEIVAQTQ